MTLPPEMLARLAGEYEFAEDAIKSCERYTLASPTVAVSQMRYAGRHLFEFVKLSAGNGSEAAERECVLKAINHCRRASFDALETLIFSQLEFIADFQNLCRTKRDVEKVYPDYGVDYSALVALQERLQAFKKVQSLTDAEKKDIVDISAQVSKLKRKILGVKVSVDRLESVEASDNIVLAVQQFLLSFTVTVLGAAVGILGVMFGVWGLMAKYPVWGKGLVMVLMLVCTAGVCSWFYRWSAKRLLTEGQRRMLSERFNISWR